MKRICYVLLMLMALFASKDSVAQKKRANHWCFGVLANLDFSSGSPVAGASTQIYSSESAASISDTAGNLLFYTEGVSVWDRTNTQMPNGTGLLGDETTTQTLIVPNPGDTNLYYIFTLASQGQSDGLNYSVVDMRMNGGKGDVSIKNTHLADAPMSEKICGVYACNNHDIWVMTHGLYSNAYEAFLVTNSGVNAPVISNVGTVHNDWVGYMKFSSDGSKIACAIGFRDTVELLDFNKVTGVVSNPLTMPMGAKVYGLEFSPDNSKLYGTYYDNTAGSSTIYQLDLTANNIPASKTTVDMSFDHSYRAMQLGPDNKIYIAEDDPSSFLSAINSPNVQGAGCNFSLNSVSLDPGGNGIQVLEGLPSFVQTYFNPLFPNIPCFTANFKSSDTVVCTGSCISFTDLTVGSPTKWRWFFQGASIDSSNVQNPPSVCYNTPGQFDVTLIVSDISGTDTVIKRSFIVAGTHEVGGLVTATRDTICAGTAGNLSLAGNSSNVIQWQSSADDDNFTGIVGATSATYKTPPLEQSAYYRALVGTGNCAAISDTLRLYVPPQLVAKFNSTASGKTVVFDSDSSSGKIRSYHWDFNDGQTSADTNPSHTFARDSTYYVCLTLDDGSNCSYTFCKYILVGASGIATVPAQGKWNVYPDPVSDYFYISSIGADTKVESIQIYDVLGRTVLSRDKDISPDPVKLDASSLSRGIYFLRIKTMETDYVQKIIKL